MYLRDIVLYCWYWWQWRWSCSFMVYQVWEIILYLLCLGGRSPGGIRCVCVCVCVCVSVLVIPWDSCLHFLRVCWKLRPETCNVSLKQYYLEMKLLYCWVMAWFAYLDGSCQQSRVQWRANSPQQTAYQHVCTTNQQRPEWNPENETAKTRPASIMLA